MKDKELAECCQNNNGKNEIKKKKGKRRAARRRQRGPRKETKHEDGGIESSNRFIKRQEILRAVKTAIEILEKTLVLDKSSPSGYSNGDSTDHGPHSPRSPKREASGGGDHSSFNDASADLSSQDNEESEDNEINLRDENLDNVIKDIT